MYITNFDIEIYRHESGCVINYLICCNYSSVLTHQCDNHANFYQVYQGNCNLISSA